MGGGDFFARMDENGVIGLDEVSAGEELEDEGSEEGGADLPWDPGAPGPEDGPSEEDLLGDLSCGLSELQDSEPLSQSPDRSLCESPTHAQGLTPKTHAPLHTAILELQYSI